VESELKALERSREQVLKEIEDLPEQDSEEVRNVLLTQLDDLNEQIRELEG